MKPVKTACKFKVFGVTNCPQKIKKGILRGYRTLEWSKNQNKILTSHKLNTFSEFISSNIHTFRELIPNKCKHISRVHIKHY